MNIIRTNKYDNKSGPVEDLFSAVERKVDNADYESGELESMRSCIDNQTKLIAILIEAVGPTSEQLTVWLARYDETIQIVP